MVILESLARVRLLTTRQVERLHFTEGSSLTQARRTRRTLERLFEENLLHRLQRRVGGVRAGSSGFVYSLSAKGQRVMQAEGPAGGTRRRRPWEPSAQYVDHVLAVSELFVSLIEAERLGHLTLLEFESEPSCWRGFSGRGGERIVLKPDAFALVAKGEYEFVNFVEVDLGSEGSATLRRKVEVYLAHARSGQEQARHGVYPRIFFLATDPSRVGRVKEALGTAMRKEPDLCTVGLLRDAVELLSGGER